MKSCAKCGEEKPLTDFHKQPKGPQGRHSYCKACFNALAREKRVRNDTPEQRQKWNLARRYGLTAAKRDAMLNEQGGRCAICREQMRRPVIDHDHATGKVRELLCHGCNLALGHIERSSGFVAAAMAYLRKHGSA